MKWNGMDEIIFILLNAVEETVPARPFQVLLSLPGQAVPGFKLC